MASTQQQATSSSPRRVGVNWEAVQRAVDLRDEGRLLELAAGEDPEAPRLTRGQEAYALRLFLHACELWEMRVVGRHSGAPIADADLLRLADEAWAHAERNAGRRIGAGGP